MMKNMNFGEWVRTQVTQEGKTMSWMAREVGVSQSLLTRWRNGTIPRTEYFLKVCVILSKVQKKPLLEVIQAGASSIGIDNVN